MTLSYIIPLYNGSRTIIRCLDSIYATGIPFEEFEVVVVDDCSTDDSVEVVERYAMTHQNIRVLQQVENKKQGGAKNTGIKAAHGKYIVFADQDDEIMSENQERVLAIAKGQQADMLSFQWIEMRDGDLQLHFVRELNETDYNGVDFCEKVFEPSESLAPWSYLYRREYLENQGRCFAENVLAEDADWIAWHLIHAQSVYRVEMPLYRWIRNSQSITSSTSWQFKADWVLFGLRKIEDAKQYSVLSPQFARVMHEDGVYNIESSFHTLWKADKYRPFFKRLKGDVFDRLQAMPWSFKTSFVMRHPQLTCLWLSMVGPVLKIAKQIKKRLKRNQENNASFSNHTHV